MNTFQTIVFPLTPNLGGGGGGGGLVTETKRGIILFLPGEGGGGVVNPTGNVPLKFQAIPIGKGRGGHGKGQGGREGGW